MAEFFTTPLTSWHVSHGAKMAPFAGWNMPIQYEGILAEHAHTRNSASIFDICHMGEFIVSGKNARQALMHAVSHSLAALGENHCRYGFLLNESGGVLDDCIIYNMGSDTYMIVVNAACIARDFETIRGRLPSDVACVDRSEQIAKIDLQGPLALDVMERLLGKDIHDLGYFAFRRMVWKEKPLLVSRTGYTGELGYELYLDSAGALALWVALLSDPRVKPAGLGARDTLRMEAGLPLYGHELDEHHTPIESGMGRMMKSEANFVGSGGLSVVREKLLAFELEGRRATRTGDRLALPGGEVVGRITSGTFAPSLGKVIAFGWVEVGKADSDEFEVLTSRTKLTAHKTDLPFYKQGTARRKFN